MSIFGAIGSAIGGYFGGAPGAAIGGSVGGGMDTNNANAASAQSANDFSAQQYASRWQTTTKDMQAAGLNPMLAYSQGVGSQPSGQQYVSQNPWANVGSAYAATTQAGPAAEASSASAAQSRALAKQADAAVDKIKAEIPKIHGDTNIDAQQRILQNTAALLNANVGIQDQEYVQRAPLLKATINKLVAETDLKYLDISAAKSMGNIGREFGQLGPIIQAIISAIGAFRR